MKRYYEPAKVQSGTIRIAELDIAPVNQGHQVQRVSVYIVLFPEDAFPIAKQFWQHSGDIFSSRAAEYCLRIMDENEMARNTMNTQDESSISGPCRRSHGHRYGSAGGHGSSTAQKSPTFDQLDDIENSTYLEERYGRNLPVAFADRAKCALRRRIAGVVTEADHAINVDVPPAESDPTIDMQRQATGIRGVQGLSEDEVYLFPCGMSAIYHAHRAALGAGDALLKSVCFG